MIRQGDVLLVPCRLTKKERAGAVPVKPEGGRLILARGEATGHHHSVSCELAEVFTVNGRPVLVAGEGAVLEHQEHAAIEIAPGEYWVVHQREYAPEEIRRVLD